MSREIEPFSTNDKMNLAVASISYLFSSLLIKNHILTEENRLFANYTDIITSDGVSYLAVPFLWAFVVGIGVESAMKPDSPLAVHMTSGMIVFLATILTAVNLASPLTLNVGNFFSAGAAGAGIALGRGTRYLAREKDW